MTSLLQRVEQATGPDRELDAAIIAWLNNAEVRRYPPADDFGPRDRWQFWSLDGAHFLGSEAKFPVPPLTASVDAALALVERVKPGSEVLMGLRQTAATQPWARVGPWWASDAIGATLPLAILAALLRSLEPGNE